MKAIKNRRAITTALACCMIPVIIILFGKLFGLLGANRLVILPIISALLFLMPGTLFFLALVLPNLDMLDSRIGSVSAAIFYRPAFKSVAYFVAAGAGLVLSFYLIFLIPNFLYFFALPVLAILYFYFVAMAKLAVKFLGWENSPYGRGINYHQFAGCGLLSAVLTLVLQMLAPFEARRYISTEFITCLGGMVGVGYMVGRALQSQYDEEQFYLENYPEQELG